MKRPLHHFPSFRLIWITRISGHYAPLILYPAEGFGGPSALLPKNLWSFMPPNCMIRSVLRIPHQHQWLWGHSGFLTGDMEDIEHYGPHHYLDIGFPTCLSNFSFLAWLEVCWEPPKKHHQWFGGHWGFLTGHMENMGYYWPHNCSWHLNPNLCANFLQSSMIRSVSRTPQSSSVTLGTLRVPDWTHGAHGLSLT